VVLITGRVAAARGLHTGKHRYGERSQSRSQHNEQLINGHHTTGAWNRTIAPGDGCAMIMAHPFKLTGPSRPAGVRGEKAAPVHGCTSPRRELTALRVSPPVAAAGRLCRR